MTIIVYGLKNCDTCRKSVKYLQNKDADVQLIDVREQPLGKALLVQWCDTFGRDAFVNKRSTTWRGLTDKEKAINTDAEAIALIQASPALMKRPVIVSGSTLILGFKPADLDTLF